MAKRKVLMVVWDVDVNKGGINSVMFRRTHLFNNEKYSSDIVTLDDKPNGYEAIEKQLHAEGRLHPSSRVINVYDYYREKMTRLKKVSEEDKIRYEQLHSHEETGMKIEEDESRTRYFFNGQYVKAKNWDDDGHLFSIDFYNDARVKSHTEFYHPKGYMISQTTYHPITGNVNQIMHYTEDGHCYLTRWFNPEDGSQMYIVLFDPIDKRAISFKNNGLFHQYFLNELVHKEPLKPFIICDGPGSSSKVRAVDQDAAYRVYAIHSTVYEAPYKRGSELKENHQTLFNNKDENATFVVLTDRQKEDLRAEFPDKFNFEVISHSMTIKENALKKKPFVASVVSRLVDEKRVDLVIKAFKYVVRDEPDATLNIYGAGEAEANLRKLVKKLKLSKHVHFKGYTTEAENVFAESQFTVITSLYEGQSLVALEAFANKTTVVAFDIDYLVQEMYDRKDIAIIVPNGDVEALGDGMIALMKDPEKAKAMGEAGYKLVQEKYNTTVQYDQWDRLFMKLAREDEE